MRVILLAVIVSIFVSITATASAQTPQHDSTNPHRLLVVEPAAMAQATASGSDSLLNGALIGAGVGVGAGLLLCRAMEPWENCRDDVGPMLGFAAIGAGIGIAIDALIRPSHNPYVTTPVSRVRAMPGVGRGAGGVHVSIKF
jgi:hypothetical protein